jgi:hypothetical protein
MTEYLDIRTLSFTSLLLCIIYGVAMILYSQKHCLFSGIRIIGAGILLEGLGFFLLGLLDFINSFLSVILANLFFLWSINLICEGLLRFRKSSLHWGKYSSVILTIVMLPAFYYYTYVVSNLPAIIIVIASCYSIQCAYCSFALFNKCQPVHNSSNHFLGSCFLLFTFFYVFRIFYTYNQAGISNFMDAGLVHALTFITIQITVLVTSMSVFWLASSELEDELVIKANTDPLTQVCNRRAME